jgi:hypothetical protein
MTEKNETVKVFTGSEVIVTMIKGELESHGIYSLVKNDFKSGVTAGFYGGTPSAIDLYIKAQDVERAIPIINDLIGSTEK